MLLGEPQASEYDWRFTVMGFPTRVTWLFWAVSAALGYTVSLGIANQYAMFLNVQVHFALLLAIWVGVSFVSILVHELGHALAYRRFGIESSIVLYQMGGLAIPGAGLLWGNMGRRRSLSQVQSIMVSAAGPGIQLLLAGAMALVAVLSGINVPGVGWLGSLLEMEISAPRSPFVFCFFYFMVYVNFWWALLNLLPIYPLDGGQIAQHVIGIIKRTDGRREAHLLGVVAGAAAALWFLRDNNTINAIFFASMAMANFQSLQSGGGRGYW